MMINNNIRKKNEIDSLLTKFAADASELKIKRDSVVAKFLKALTAKQIEEIRQSIKGL